MKNDIIYSIIIPAYNEEDFLGKTLSSIQSAMKHINLNGEIIVVDNDSTDKTAQIAKEFGVKLIFEKFHQIGTVRNTGAQIAKGKYLIFVDADTLISSELLKNALDNLESGMYAGGGSTVLMDKDISSLKRIVKFWNVMSVKYNLAAGSFIYCLKTGFDAAGGFNDKIYASEEIWFIKNLKKWAKKEKLQLITIDKYPVVTSARKFEWHSQFKIYIYMLIFTIFPFAVRYRLFCRLWYKRPKIK